MQELLGCMDLTSSMDWMHGAFEKNCTTLSTGDMYHTATKADSPDPAYSFLWHKYAPPKVRFFLPGYSCKIESKANATSSPQTLLIRRPVKFATKLQRMQTTL